MGQVGWSVLVPAADRAAQDRDRQEKETDELAAKAAKAGCLAKTPVYAMIRSKVRVGGLDVCGRMPLPLETFK